MNSSRTQESLQFPDTMANGRPWPKVSIVTPSFNQVEFIEDTIRSVLLQGYPNLEYIIMDGGSTDGSVDIIRRYQDRLTYWVSEPDLGQTHAINQGFQRATGEILAWLNSDDLYCPGAVRTAVEFLESHPGVAIAYGRADAIDAMGRVIFHVPMKEFHLTQCLARLESPIAQPATFMRREAIQRVGLLDQTLHFVMDWDYWIRVAMAGLTICPVPHTLARFRVHPYAKTVARLAESGEEMTRWVERFFAQPLPPQIADVQRRSHSQALLALGSGYFSADRFASARRAVFKGIAMCPTHLTIPRVLLLVATALLPAPGIQLARLVRRKLSRHYKARSGESTAGTA